MLGYEVTQNTLNMKVAQAVLEMRAAFEKIKTIAKWLENHPNSSEGEDPLVVEFGYTVDEAYVIRAYFETFNALRLNNSEMFDIGRKMTGLE